MTFDKFWADYPRKRAKPAAQRAWEKIKPSERLDVMEGLARAVQSRQWKAGIIPHPATWLNGRRWEDAPEGPAPVDPHVAKRIGPDYASIPTGCELDGPPGETVSEAWARMFECCPELFEPSPLAEDGVQWPHRGTAH